MAVQTITIAAAGDLHGHLPAIPPADLLLIAGDIAPPAIERDPEAVRSWFAAEVAPWRDALAVPEVIAIPGNHDFWAQDLGRGAHTDLFGISWTLLIDAETRSASGLRIYGTPWTRNDYGSAFEAPLTELATRLAPVPEDGLDVLLIHCPPYGHGDEIGEPPAQTHMGTHEIAATVARTRPRLALYGHAHQGHGYRHRTGTGTGTELANVSVRTDYAGGLRAAHLISLSRPPSTR
ncbi:MAG TPA: metallophosphoesterase [Solirubrobacteraceae bacterium]|nr:metallophosphoesterase [Solirubrobacteraceae bacterium]